MFSVKSHYVIQGFQSQLSMMPGTKLHNEYILRTKHLHSSQLTLSYWMKVTFKVNLARQQQGYLYEEK